MILTFFLSFILNSPATANSFTYEDITHLIKDHSVTSLEQLLPLLPSSFRSSYTLLYGSHSLQEASFENPRAILFGADATLTCSFNGSLTQYGSDNLECIQFRPESRSFDFRQIQFPTVKNKLKKVEFSQSGRSADQRVSCGACHGGTDPRPNWNEYNHWGATYDADGGHYPIQKPYWDFVKIRASHPRYRYLIQDHYLGAPFTDPTEGYTDQYSKRPNFRYAMAVTRLNGQRISRIFDQTLSEWQKIFFAMSDHRCKLSDSQIQQIKEAGKSLDNLSTGDHLEDIYSLFQLTHVSPRDLNTYADDPGTGRFRYYFDAGHDSNVNNTTQAIIQTLAQRGNESLRKVIQKSPYYFNHTCEKPSGNCGFYQSLDQALPLFEFVFPDICDALTEAFLKAYLSSKESIK